MREIKFRVFYKKANKMLYPENHLFPWKNMLRNDNLTLMQYTGLKDNTKWEQLTINERKTWLDSGKTEEEWNGKEIYEGDIVQQDFLLKKNNKFISVIKWKAPSFILDRGAWATSKKTIEVIGNIYENPELLKQ